jgi:membrane protease YdiL (CAAX protease family)
MSQWHPFDLFFAAVLAAGMPLWARREFAHLRIRVSAGASTARLRAYARTIWIQWSLVALLALHWSLRGRDGTALGLALEPSWRFAVAGLLCLVGVGLLVVQLRTVMTDDEARGQAEAELAPLVFLLPHDARELRGFYAVSFTAGTCEEILYRGFLPWFLALAMPLPMAFVSAAILFGLGHVYQGPAGVVKTSILGVVMGGLVWLSGSLLPAVVLHIAIDAINGRLAFHVVQHESEDEV